MISLVKNLKCISRLNIHYYPNRRYKSYITSLKAVIAGKSLISAGLDINKILHFVFYDKILQIYQQHWVRKFCWHILSKYQQISKNGGRGGGGEREGGVLHLPTPSQLARPWSHHIKKSLQLLPKSCFSLDQENFDCPPITTLYIYFVT